MENYSSLLSNFTVSRNSIKLINPDIDYDEFVKAVRTFIHLTSSHGFKLGDLLNLCREKFGMHQIHLIPALVDEKTQTKKNLEKLMCLAGAYSPSERNEGLADSVYWELQSVQDRRLRKTLTEQILAKVQAGLKVKQTEIRKLVRSAKLSSGQGIRSNRGKKRQD